MKPGLLSVTFRNLSTRTIISLARRAGLVGIEWGGDVHVPPDDIARAIEVGQMTREAGLDVSAYGSYYRLGHEDSGPAEAILETARALEADIVRVWAGREGSDSASPEYRERVARDGRRFAELAERAGVRIACEWHGHTLTDTADSASRLFKAVDHPNFLTFWQPRNGQPTEICLADMDTALPRLIGLHVFHWDWATRERLPLESGFRAWDAYLAKASIRGDLFASLEFVADDDPERMVADATTLREWLSRI
jgi:sugar phosphate isomerase/epimerase